VMLKRARHGRLTAGTSIEDGQTRDLLFHPIKERQWPPPFWEEHLWLKQGPSARLPAAKSNLSSATLRQAAMTAIQTIDNKDITIYTDGSKSGDNIGAAFCTSTGHTWRGKLPGWSGVLAAEVVAIDNAIKWAAKEMKTGQRVVVLTDSLSAQQLILHGDHKCHLWEERRSIVRTAKWIHNTYGGTAEIGWIPSHCGVAGNERADRLAGKAAANHPGTALIKCRPTPNELKTIVKVNSNKVWQHRWDNHRPISSPSSTNTAPTTEKSTQETRRNQVHQAAPGHRPISPVAHPGPQTRGRHMPRLPRCPRNP